MPKIMIIDDEENVLNALRRILRRLSDWDVETFSDPQAALRRAHVSRFDLYLSDYRMPQMDGVQLLTEIKQLQPEAMRLILSGYTDLTALMDAINKAEIYRFVSKPWNDYELVITLQQALAYHHIQCENRALADQVRAQQQQLSQHKSVLEQLSNKHPSIFTVNWAADGSILLSDDELG
jgi:DNA-binding NtrC family response regulator